MGILIIIEGISGSGKSLFAQKLCKLLLKCNIPHVSYGGFNITEQSTELTKFCHYLVKRERFIGFPIISETQLLLSEIVMDIELNVKRELRNNKVVIYENFFDSIYIYQSSRIKIMNIADKEKDILQQYLDQTIRVITDTIDIPEPDSIVFLNTPIDVCNNRIANRDNLSVTDRHVRLQSEIQKKYFEYYGDNDNVMICSNESLHSEMILNKLVSFAQRKWR